MYIGIMRLFVHAHSLALGTADTIYCPNWLDINWSVVFGAFWYCRTSLPSPKHSRSSWGIFRPTGYDSGTRNCSCASLERQQSKTVSDFLSLPYYETAVPEVSKAGAMFLVTGVEYPRLGYSPCSGQAYGTTQQRAHHQKKCYNSTCSSFLSYIPSPINQKYNHMTFHPSCLEIQLCFLFPLRANCVIADKIL